MYVGRHAITKYIEKINKSYSIQKMLCFRMNGSMNTIFWGLINNITAQIILLKCLQIGDINDIFL